jgi:hypothetical protein
LAVAALLTVPVWDRPVRNDKAAGTSLELHSPFGELPHFRFDDAAVPLARGTLDFALRLLGEYQHVPVSQPIKMPGKAVLPTGAGGLPEGCEPLGRYGTELGRMAGRCVA